MPQRNTVVAPVRRRISPVDPAPGAWAVLGVGAKGADVLRELTLARIPALGYDRRPAGADDLPARWGHEVIAVDEIDDMDLLAVTSQDAATREINTDYFSGVVLATGEPIPAFLDPEVLNVHGALPVLAHRTFTPRHPAVLVADTEQHVRAAVVAGYAVALRDDPRRALAFHRHVCARIMPGWPQTPPDPDDGADYRDLLARDLDVLCAR